VMVPPAEDLSPDSTPRNISSPHSTQSGDERWADIAIDTMQPTQQPAPLRKQDHLTLEVCLNDSELSYSDVICSAGDLNSAGSRLHDSGRCKPCAFFHTKGCNSGSQCEFCHRCPAHEKQRRKRLRRQLCRSLLSNFDERTPGDVRLPHPTKAGHTRMNSIDTASTCSGWVSSPEGQFAHSRTTSSSSHSPAHATSAYESGDAGNMAYVRATTDQSGFAMYPSPQSQMMSPQGSLQPMMPTMVMMQPCDESWSEARADHGLETLPVIEAHSMAPNSHGLETTLTGTGDALLSPPAMQAVDVSNLGRTEPPPPPQGVPMIPGMPQDPSAAVSGGYEQHPNMPVSPVGYVTSPCGAYQYALVPVPVPSYDSSGALPASPTYQDYQQQMAPSFCCGPAYESGQQWGAPYDTVLTSPYSGAAGNESMAWW